MAHHSDTSEFRLFKKLANPLQVDFSTKNEVQQHFPRGEAEEIVSDDEDQPLLLPHTSTRSMARSAAKPPLMPVVQEQTLLHDEASEDDGGDVEEDEEEDDDDDDADDEDVDDARHSGEDGHSDAFPLPHAPHAPVQEEINREKQGYLLELEKLRQQGVQLTKMYSMGDTLEEIQYEYERIKMNQDSINAVNFMRDVMKLALTGVELANAKLGPVLHLDGWSKEVTSDMHRYDHCLERLYKKHWRKGSMSPESELLFLLLGSMIMYHFKSKYFGGTSTSAASATSRPAAARAAPPPAMPRNAPPPAPVSTSSSAGRPVMRAPSADNGGSVMPPMGGGMLGGGGGGMPTGLMSMMAKML